MPSRPRSKKRPTKSPRTNKILVGNILLPKNQVTIPKPFVPTRQRGSLLAGAPLFSSTTTSSSPYTNPITSQKKKRRKKKSKKKKTSVFLNATPSPALSVSPSKQTTSTSVIPQSTPSILFGKRPPSALDTTIVLPVVHLDPGPFSPTTQQNVLKAMNETTQQIADDANENGQILCNAKVMYDYDGSESNGKNITLKAGDIVQVTEMDLESYPETDGWWHGFVKNGQWGAFPLAYVYVPCIYENKKYNIIPGEWNVHNNEEGDRTKIGVLNPIERVVTLLTGEVLDWNTMQMDGEPKKKNKKNIQKKEQQNIPIDPANIEVPKRQTGKTITIDEENENEDSTPRTTPQTLQTLQTAQTMQTPQVNEPEQIGIPFGSPRLFHDYRNKQKAKEATDLIQYEHDANLKEAQHLGSTVFFHSTGLQDTAMTNFSEEANERSERRIRYLQRLEEKMIKAVENDYSRMKKRCNVLQDQRDVRRALQKSYEAEDQWISELRVSRKLDRQHHKEVMDGDQEKRTQKAHEEAERQRQTNRYIQYLKDMEISKNRKSRNTILQQRDDGTKRALEYKRSKLKVIQDEKDQIKKKNKVKTVRRQRAIERNLKTHSEMTDRINRLLEYRNMYNSEMKNVYDDLSQDVEHLRMKQRARNVFAVGESPIRGVERSPPRE